MGVWLSRSGPLWVLLAGVPILSHAATITGTDSTQPRGATPPARNERGQPLEPVMDGFRAPAYRATEQEDAYASWAGTMMANAARDPAFFATLAVANRDLIELANSLAGDPKDPGTPLGGFLERLGLAPDVSRGPDGRLRPEDLLPVTADLCLRCHSPVGWLEAHSEPPTVRSAYLKGQFWGAALLENPVDAKGGPRRVDTARESETEMEGVDCDFCHRTRDLARRTSRHDGSTMAAGNGGFFVARSDPFDAEVEPEYDVLGESEMCGICHDVTNPLLETETRVGGKVPDMLHPIERTYTEWYWSAYRGEETCQDCHEPMDFQGAQTWMLHPGLEALWGKLDRKWREEPYGYGVPERAALYAAAAQRNREFMRTQAAEVELIAPASPARAGEPLRVEVKVTNKAGHKLPTGFAEGRQAWIEIRAEDAKGRLIYQDGRLDEDGRLVRTRETKVYEQVAMAGRPERRGEDGRTCYVGYAFLDGNGDGCVDGHESHFHFVLMNAIQKDNRIPPKGYDKEAFTKDGAFIVPFDPKDTDYADGQHWDVTPYRFVVPPDAEGPLRITATLWYQTFSREYVDFLAERDEEKTQRNGGRARNLPAGPYAGHATWGAALRQLWNEAGQGAPVSMGEARLEVALGDAGAAGSSHETADPSAGPRRERTGRRRR